MISELACDGWELRGAGRGRESLTYTLKQVEKVFAGLVADLFGAEFRARSHGGPTQARDERES